MGLSSRTRSIASRALLAGALLLVGPSEAALATRPGHGSTSCSGFTVSPDSTYWPATSATLQTALDCAPLGSTIILGTTAPYVGSFKLSNKSGTGWITVVSAMAPEVNSTPDLPPAGVRVGPADDAAGALARVQAPSGSSTPVLSTATGAHHYRFIGIRFATDHWLDTLVLLGSNSETSTSQLPHHVAFDRCSFAGSPADGTKHGLVANAGQGSTFPDDQILVENSYFQDFKDHTHDAQAILVWNGWGPFLIQNNYLEASGENVMFGGGDPTIRNLIPSNIQVYRNHVYKPLSWVGLGWSIKNLFELKNASDVDIAGNVFENNWIEADQLGWAIAFTPRNQDGRARWSAVRNVTFQNNLVKNARNGFDLLGTDYTNPSGPLDGVAITNNLLLNINPSIAGAPPLSAYPEPGQMLYLINGPRNVTVTHNTSFQSGAITFSNISTTSGFVFSDNVVRHNQCLGTNNCGIAGGQISNGQLSAPTAPGDPTLQQYFTPPYTVSGNVMFDGNVSESQYPSPNSFPSSVTFVTPDIDLRTGLTSSPDPDYGIVTGDGTTPGVDWDTLKAAVQGVVQSHSQ